MLGFTIFSLSSSCNYVTVSLLTLLQMKILLFWLKGEFEIRNFSLKRKLDFYTSLPSFLDGKIAYLLQENVTLLKLKTDLTRASYMLFLHTKHRHPHTPIGIRTTKMSYPTKWNGRLHTKN